MLYLLGRRMSLVLGRAVKVVILVREMCAQCMTTAAVAVGAAGGLRAWLATRRRGWLTERRLRSATVVLLSLAVIVAGIGLG